MNSEKPRLLSGRAIKIVSLAAATPLLVLELIFLWDRQYWLDAFSHGFLLSFMCIFSGTGLVYCAIETLLRCMTFVDKRRLPWFSLFLLPSLFVLYFLYVLGHLLVYPKVTLGDAADFVIGIIWMFGVVLLYQAIGHLSLVKIVEDDL